MKIRDKATGEIYSIDNYDGNPGDPDYMQDIIGNCGYIDISYNDEDNIYESDMDTIQWWIDYVDGMRDVTDKIDAVKAAMPDDMRHDDYDRSIERANDDSQGCDYDQHASNMLMAAGDWIEENIEDEEIKTELLTLLND